MIPTKTKQALDLFSKGEYKQALAIFKTFKLGFTKEEKRNIEIAYESMTGKSKFYQCLGIDTDSIIKESINLISQKYGER